jgi:stearoyl-CoA desaturase (delta-9 desaturase)
MVPFALGYLIDGSLFGGFLGFLWGGLVRIFLTHHVTWSINSVCHVFGRRPYASGDYSTNNFICALLGFGEGWHNNHHAFPTSARHGLAWWQIDVSWMVICVMRVLGLAWNVKLPTARALEAKRVR